MALCTFELGHLSDISLLANLAFHYYTSHWVALLCVLDHLLLVHMYIMRRFEQHVHFNKDRTMEHSQWKVAEFSQELLLVSVPVFDGK